MNDVSIQSKSYRPDFIRISSTDACTREPRGTPLCASESLQPHGSLESHCKYARLPVCQTTSTNPTGTGVHYDAL